MTAARPGASGIADDFGFASSGCAPFPAHEPPPGPVTSRYGFVNPRRDNDWFEIWTWQHSQLHLEWPIKPHLPTVLRGLRRSVGLSQAGFANALHVARVTVERWEAGTVRPFRGDLHTLLALVKPLARDQRSRGQLLGLAAAVVCPTLTRPTAIYTARQLASPLRSAWHDHRDLAPALVYALTCAEVIVALDEADESSDAQYLPVVGAGAVDRHSAPWEHRVVGVAARLSDRDRDLWVELGARLAATPVGVQPARHSNTLGDVAGARGTGEERST
jgi:transcriptional regulator with XRE-family HTH domain